MLMVVLMTVPDIYEGGPPKTWNYLLEGGLLVVQLPSLGECSSVIEHRSGCLLL